MDKEQIAASFKKNGYLLAMDVLTAEESKRYLDGFLAYEKRLGGKVTGAWRFKSHLVLQWMYELVTHPSIMNIVSSIFGPDILCWSTDLFPKDPGTGQGCGWHQDSTYVGMKPADALTVWVALTESNESNGCVRFERGSHLKAQLPHSQTFAEDSMLLYGQEVAVEVDLDNTVAAILKPGQVSVHHTMTVHSSEPNNGSTRRIGVALRYCGAYVQQAEGIGDSATLVAGKSHGTFALESPPSEDFGEKEVENHRLAVGPVGPENLIVKK